MPNIAAVLKTEVSRVARKEVRSETRMLKQAVKAYRSEIALLKRRTRALEQTLLRLSKSPDRSQATDSGMAMPGKSRFSAKGLASQRRRLGLSAHDLGRLIGASSQSIYNWEQGKARPLERHRSALAGIKAIGRREAAARLALLQT